VTGGGNLLPRAIEDVYSKGAGDADAFFTARGLGDAEVFGLK
jgi:hypothetical protein